MNFGLEMLGRITRRKETSNRTNPKPDEATANWAYNLMFPSKCRAKYGLGQRIFAYAIEPIGFHSDSDVWCRVQAQQLLATRETKSSALRRSTGNPPGQASFALFGRTKAPAVSQQREQLAELPHFSGPDAVFSIT